AGSGRRRRSPVAGLGRRRERRGPGGASMRFAVAADHAGYPLKARVASVLRDLGHDVTDLGTHTPAQPDDYPDFAVAVAAAIRQGDAERAVLICGSGVGASVAASKSPGIR